MSVTRIFRRRAAVVADPAKNEGTALIEHPLLRAETSGDRIDARREFVARYPIIRRALEHRRHLGVMVLAFDAQQTAVGQAWLKASLDKTRALIIGRHSMCSLALPQEYAEVSLRHLAVTVRAIDHDEVRIRVLDLNTPTGFFDEEGRVLQAVVSEGPMFLRVGRVVLMVLVTDEGSPIPEDAEDAYLCIPERIFIEERHGSVGDRRRRPSPPEDDLAPEATLLKSLPGPMAAAGDLIDSDEMEVGALLIRSGGNGVRRSVGPSALDRGILIGRYARCDVGATSDDDSRLSRVHFLLLRDGDEVFGIDTASTNGSCRDGRSILMERLEAGRAYDLAGEIEIVWHPSE